MACEVNNKEINSQCAELLVRPTYIIQCTMHIAHCVICNRVRLNNQSKLGYFIKFIRLLIQQTNQLYKH